MSPRWLATLAPGPATRVHAYAAALSLHLVFHNFCLVQRSLGVTPAMAAGLSDHAWNVHDIVSLRTLDSRRQNAESRLTSPLTPT